MSGEEKICKKCNKNKKIKEFPTIKEKIYNWVSNTCRKCSNENRYNAPGYKESAKKYNEKQKQRRYHKKLLEVENKLKDIKKEDKKSKEIWKTIHGWDKKYQASNLGNIRKLPSVRIDNGKLKSVSYSILKQQTKFGYKTVTLISFSGNTKSIGVHRLVMLAFKGYSDLTVNHINMDKSDNRLENLEYLSTADNTREAIINGKMNNKYTTTLLGSYLHKGRYISNLTIDGICYNLGSYDTAEEAHEKYMFYLNRYRKTNKLPDYININKTSLIRGVDFHKASNKWRVRLEQLDNKYIGIFKTEEIAERVSKICFFMFDRGIKIDDELKKKIRLKYGN